MRHLPILASVIALVILAGAAGVLAVSRLGDSAASPGDCVPSNLVPNFAPALPADDCVTVYAEVQGHKGEYGIGTAKGILGLVINGDLKETRSVPNDDGPVSGLLISGDMAVFAVEKGIGVFSVARSEFVKLDPLDEFVRDEYFVSPGQAGEFNENGALVVTDGGGGEQRFSFQGSVSGRLCLSFLSSRGAIPYKPWCLPPGTLFEYVAPTPAPRPPLACTPLAVADSASVAPVRELVLGDSGGQETRVEIEVGKDYRLRLGSSDSGVLRMWAFAPFGGNSVCSVAVTETVDLAINIPFRGEFEFYDQLRPHIRGVIAVK